MQKAQKYTLCPYLDKDGYDIKARGRYPDFQRKTAGYYVKPVLIRCTQTGWLKHIKHCEKCEFCLQMGVAGVLCTFKKTIKNVQQWKKRTY